MSPASPGSLNSQQLPLPGFKNTIPSHKNMSRISPPHKKNDVGHCDEKTNKQTKALLGLAPLFWETYVQKQCHFWGIQNGLFSKGHSSTQDMVATSLCRNLAQRRGSWNSVAVFGRLDSDQRKLAILPHPGNDAFHGRNSMSNIFQPHGLESLDIRLFTCIEHGTSASPCITQDLTPTPSPNQTSSPRLTTQTCSAEKYTNFEAPQVKVEHIRRSSTFLKKTCHSYTHFM